MYLYCEIHSHFRERSKGNVLQLQLQQNSYPNSVPVLVVQVSDVTPRDVLSITLCLLQYCLEQLNF